MFTRTSEPDGWIRTLIDLFAMLVSSVIIILMIYSIDLDPERDAHKLERVSETGDDSYLLLFPDTEQRLFDQWLSVGVGAIIILVYAGPAGAPMARLVHLRELPGNSNNMAGKN